MDQTDQNESGEVDNELDITEDPNHMERISNHSQNSEENGNYGGNSSALL